MPKRYDSDIVEARIKSDPEFAWAYVQQLREESVNAIKSEQTRIAKALFDLMEAEIKGIEELDQECPDDEPVSYCVHDLRALLFNVLYEVMHKKLGFHIQSVDNADRLVPGPLFPNSQEIDS